MNSKFWFGFLAAVLSAALAGAAPVPVKMVFFDDYPPFSYREEGVLKGIYIDIAKEVFEKQLKSPLVLEGYPWARAQAMVREGVADGFITIPTPEQRTYVEVTEPAILSTRMTVYTALANPDLAKVKAARTLAEVKGLRQASYLGSGWAKQNLDAASVDWSPNIDSLIPLISGNSPFVLIDADLVVDWILKNQRLTNRVWKGPAVDESPVHLCLSKRSLVVGLVPRISRILADLKTSGRIEQIVQSYR